MAVGAKFQSELSAILLQSDHRLQVGSSGSRDTVPPPGSAQTVCETIAPSRASPLGSHRGKGTYLVPLELEEAVQIAGIEGRAQLRAVLGVAEIGVLGRRRLGSEGIKGAGLVGVLQRQIDPVEELGRLVDRSSTGVYG